jgi:hypothetical protein
MLRHSPDERDLRLVPSSVSDRPGTSRITKDTQ